MRRQDIYVFTSLRFVAATLVVIEHYNVDAGLFPRSLAEFGYQAVAFFFLLSCFIMTYVYLDERKSGGSGIRVPDREFYALRITRIAPAYLLALAISFALFLNTHSGGQVGDLKSLALGLVLVPSAMQAWYPPAALAWNIAVWSLSVELFFYFVFPYLARICSQVPAQRLLVFAALGFIATELLRNAASAILAGAVSGTSIVYFIAYFPLFHLSLFVAGIALARVFRQSKALPAYDELWFAVCFCAIAFIIWIKPTHAWLGNPIVVVSLFVGLIYWGAGASGRFSRALGFRPLSELGHASFSIYILHIPLLQWWRYCSDGLAISTALDFELYFLLLVIVSLLSARFVETRGRIWMLANLHSRTASATSSVRA